MRQVADVEAHLKGGGELDAVVTRGITTTNSGESRISQLVVTMERARSSFCKQAQMLSYGMICLRILLD